LENIKMKRLRKQLKKIEGGAKKHGGLLKAAGVQADKLGRDADKALGGPSALVSSIPEKRKAAENSLKDTVSILTGGAAYPGREDDDTVIEPVIPAPLLPAGELDAPHVESKKAVLDDESIEDIDVNAKDLSLALRNYIRQESITDEVFTALAGIFLGKDLSNAEIASQVLAYGNKDVNAQVKAWVMKHIPESSEASALKTIAGKYFAAHTSEMDVLSAIKSDANVSTLASALFATNHSELSAEIAAHLIGAETILESAAE
jgi:hypothetical protein